MSARCCETLGVATKQNASLGARLRELRTSSGRSLREVAGRAGINHGYLSQLERGEVVEPAPSTLHRLADAYEVPFTVLMQWAGYVEATENDLTPGQAIALSFLGDNPTEEELRAVRAVIDAIRSRTPNFPSAGDSLDAQLTPLQRRDIRAHVEALLRRADALGTFPTPLDHVLEVANLVTAGEIVLQPDEQHSLRRRFGSLVDQVLTAVRGAVHLRAREIYVAPDLHELRRRFVLSHEIGHAALPWQHDTLAYLDDEHRLSPGIRVLFEREANQAAIELLAQGDALRKEADDSRLTFDLITSLSVRFQISIQATARRVVEDSKSEVALAIRFRGRSGHLGPSHLYTSAAFDRRVAWPSLPPDAAQAGRTARETQQRSTFFATDQADNFIELEAEALDTGHAVLSLFTTPKRGRHMRRLLSVS